MTIGSLRRSFLPPSARKDCGGRYYCGANDTNVTMLESVQKYTFAGGNAAQAYVIKVIDDGELYAIKAAYLSTLVK